jgi:hypothetical protein
MLENNLTIGELLQREKDLQTFTRPTGETTFMVDVGGATTTNKRRGVAGTQPIIMHNSSCNSLYNLKLHKGGKKW